MHIIADDNRNGTFSPDKTFELAISELQKIASTTPIELTPAENYYIVQDISHVDTTGCPVLTKGHSISVNEVKMKPIIRACEGQYSGVVNSEGRKVTAFHFMKDALYGTYLVASLKSEFEQLQKEIQSHSLSKILLRSADRELGALAQACIDEIFTRADIAEFLHSLLQNSETFFPRIASHCANVAFLTTYIGTSYAKHVLKLTNLERTAKSLALGAFLHDLGSDWILKKFEFGSHKFIDAWGKKAETVFKLFERSAIYGESKIMLKFQHKNVVSDIPRIGFHTKILQIANALDCMLNGHAILKIGRYYDIMRSPRTPEAAITYIIIRSRRQRHGFDYEQIFDPDIVEYTVNLFGLSNIWNYQEMLKNRVRDAKCGEAIISPCETQPVTALCPHPGRTISHGCSGCSSQANVIYREQVFHRCKELHLEVFRINEEFKVSFRSPQTK